MGTITNNFRYELDVTGRSPANRIAEEFHTLTRVNWRTYHFIVPRCAPYFNLNVSVVHVDNTGNRRELREGIDWVPSYYYLGASRACAAPVYGGISFLNMDLVGQIIISYNTIGGEWVLDDAGLAQVLANYKLNPLITTWEQIANVPKVFPPEPHEWDLIDMVGEKEVVEAIYDIADAIRRKNGTSGSGGSGSSTDLTNHLNDHNNPHQTTKTHVGLGNVENYSVVPLTTAADSEANDLYTTPASVRAIIEAAVGKALRAHITNKNNPHEVDTYTKSEMDTLLADKVGSRGIAYDSERFKGKSYTEFKAELKDEFKRELPSATLSAEDLRKITADVVTEVKKAGATNASSLEGKTLEEVVAAAVAKAAESTDTKLTAAKTAIKDQVKAELQVSGLNANTFNGLSPNAYAARVLAGKAADSALLDGKSLQAIQLAVTNAVLDTANEKYTKYWEMPGSFSSKEKRHYKLFTIAANAAITDTSTFTFEIQNAVLFNRNVANLGKEIGATAKVTVDLSKFKEYLANGNAGRMPAEGVSVEWVMDNGLSSRITPYTLSNISNAFKLVANREADGTVSVYLTTAWYSRTIIVRADFINPGITASFSQASIIDTNDLPGTVTELTPKMYPNSYVYGEAAVDTAVFTKEPNASGKGSTYKIKETVNVSLDTAKDSSVFYLEYPDRPNAQQGDVVLLDNGNTPNHVDHLVSITTPNSSQLANASVTGNNFIHTAQFVLKNISSDNFSNILFFFNGNIDRQAASIAIQATGDYLITAKILLTKTETAGARAARVLSITSQRIEN